ncbi:hypothetical protein [Sulfuricaulis sp.]|jgi:hypothetical protein|uniref:hypothetical protein n=1 Tax=Sulfuricaulis sp. TaxID=2003553 RepID=UPI003559FF7E
MVSVKKILVPIATGWIFLIIEQAVYTFVIPHGPHFAPEIGKFGSFMFFSAFLSLGYLAASAVSESLLFRRGENSRIPSGVFGQSIIFSVMATVFTVVLLQSDLNELAPVFLFFLLPGAVNVVIRHRLSAATVPNTN